MVPSRLAHKAARLVLEHPDLDWEWLVRAAKVNDLQNKLGFVTNVARRLAKKLDKLETVSLLREKESVLEKSRLVREDTLCHDSLTQSVSPAILRFQAVNTWPIALATLDIPKYLQADILKLYRSPPVLITELLSLCHSSTRRY